MWCGSESLVVDFVFNDSEAGFFCFQWELLCSQNLKTSANANLCNSRKGCRATVISSEFEELDPYLDFYVRCWVCICFRFGFFNLYF